jgi:hypothetical protein
MASWSAESKNSTSWVDVVQSGTVAAQFELPEPIGGLVWTAEEKDS